MDWLFIIFTIWIVFENYQFLFFWFLVCRWTVNFLFNVGKLRYFLSLYFLLNKRWLFFPLWLWLFILAFRFYFYCYILLYFGLLFLNFFISFLFFLLRFLLSYRLLCTLYFLYLSLRWDLFCLINCFLFWIF
mgnify:CR=1 FL=1